MSGGYFGCRKPEIGICLGKQENGKQDQERKEVYWFQFRNADKASVKLRKIRMPRNAEIVGTGEFSRGGNNVVIQPAPFVLYSRLRDR